jgi:hypothetical protein
MKPLVLTAREAGLIVGALANTSGEAGPASEIAAELAALGSRVGDAVEDPDARIYFLGMVGVAEALRLLAARPPGPGGRGE